MSSSKKIDLKGDFAAGIYLTEAQKPIPPPLHTVYVYLQSINSDKHLPQSPFPDHFFMTTFCFGVYIDPLEIPIVDTSTHFSIS